MCVCNFMYVPPYIVPYIHVYVYSNRAHYHNISLHSWHSTCRHVQLYTPTLVQSMVEYMAHDII